jgi:hypothetical protein
MVSFKHLFSSGKADGTDSTLVKPSDWNAEHKVETAAEAVVLGRSVGVGPGAVQEIPMSIATAVAAARFVNSIEWSYSTTPMVGIPMDTTVFNFGAGTFSAAGAPDGGHKWIPGAGIWALQAGLNCSFSDLASNNGFAIRKWVAGLGDPVDLGWWAGSFWAGDNTSAEISCIAQLGATDVIQASIAINGLSSYWFDGDPYTFLSGFRIRP